VVYTWDLLRSSLYFTETCLAQENKETTKFTLAMSYFLTEESKTKISCFEFTYNFKQDASLPIPIMQRETLSKFSGTEFQIGYCDSSSFGLKSKIEHNSKNC
jgi:hypothetical protein